MRIWRPYTQEKTAAPPHKVKAASGAHFTLESGQRLFDGISSWWVITHGHCHPAIAEAIQKQSEKIDQILFANFSHDPAEELVELLKDHLPPALSSVFFSDNGSTAVEVAMKMAYQCQQQRGATGRTKFVAFEHAYHGDTCGSMSVSGESVYTQAYGPLRFEVLRASQGKFNSDPLETWILGFRDIVRNQGEEIAAVIIEPLVQGAGGMICWPAEAVREIVRLSRESGILVIFDEVMTGFGRTGSLFAFEQLGVIPDLLCVAKGLTGGALPLSLTIATDFVYDSFLSEHPKAMLFHGHSFTANPVACAAACASLQLFREDQTIEKIQSFRVAHEEALRSFKLPFKETRVCGTIGALELENPNAQYGGTFGRDFSEACLKEGLFVRPMGSLIYLMPTYASTPQEIQQAWQIIERVLSR